MKVVRELALCGCRNSFSREVELGDFSVIVKAEVMVVEDPSETM